jgi:excisionase family DNA binding protein
VAPSTTHIKISGAAERLGVTSRRVKQLIAEGKLKAVKVEAGEHEDGRVRNLVSVRSLNALIRKRAKKGRR